MYAVILSGGCYVIAQDEDISICFEHQDASIGKGRRINQCNDLYF